MAETNGCSNSLEGGFEQRASHYNFHSMYITNLLKNILGISWRIMLVCKLEIMWFWYKACNAHIIRVHVKLLSFIPIVLRILLQVTGLHVLFVCV
jgi:hypothetical protein